MNDVVYCEHCNSPMKPPTESAKLEARQAGFDPEGDNVLLCTKCYEMLMLKYKQMMS